MHAYITRRPSATQQSPPRASPGGVAAPPICIIRRDPDHASSDIRRRAAIESRDELEGQLRWLPRGVREDKVREEPCGVGRDLRDEMVDTEQGLELEDVGEGPRLLELRIEVHQPSERRP